jgi:hypothetical protein
MVEIVTILSTFSGLIGVGAGAAGSYFVMRSKQRRITDRRRAGSYFDNQAEHLIDLYSGMRACFNTLNKYANHQTLSQQDFDEEIKPVVAEFEENLRQADLYLTDQEYKQIEDVFGVFARTELHLHWKAYRKQSSNPPRSREMNWGDLSKTYQSSRKSLKRMIRERYVDIS